MARDQIDTDLLIARANDLVGRLVDGRSLDRLLATMIDYEVQPAFLWHQPYAEVRAAAETAIDALRPHVEGLEGADKDILDEMARALLVFDQDPSKGLLALAMQPRYYSIPDSLLDPPTRDSRVLAAIPELAERIDKRGLLDIADRWDPRPDVLFVGRWAVPYHQLLRRSFSSRVNDMLVGHLLNLRRTGLQVRIAIDERRMHPRSEHVRFEERDTWSGPPFRESRIDDPAVRRTEVTTYGWPIGVTRLPWEADERVSVRTSLADGIRTVEIEEITAPSPRSASGLHLVRYLHAQRDIGRHVFVHADGAVRYYIPASYEARREARWPTGTGDDSVDRRKVWRVDGDMGTARWSELVALWFRGSRLVLEALQGLGGPLGGSPLVLDHDDGFMRPEVRA
jgi:hypothetical protein